MLLTSTLIKNKIDTILKESDNISEPPEGIYENLGNNLLRLSMKFTSSKDRDWLLDIPDIETFNITQQYEEKIGDLIQCHIRVEPLELIQLINRYQELVCVLTIEHYLIDTTSDIDENMLPIVKQYNVFIKNMENILQSVNVKQLMKTKEDEDLENLVSLREHSETTILVELQLIDDALYTLHKQFINCMLRNVTVDKAIKYITRCFNIKKCNYIPSSNTNTIKHFNIPPEKAYFNTIYNYIQEKYGVYGYDINYYFTDDVLYIYPKNDTGVTKNKLIHIINSEPNKFLGLSRLYQINSDYSELFIINPTASLSKNMYYQGIETHGTNVAIYRTDRSINMVDNKDSKNINIPTDNLKIIDTGSNTLLKEKSINLKIHPSSNNMLKILSEMTQTQFEYITVKLPSYFPFTQQENNQYSIIPGNPIILYYDEPSQVKTKTGIVTYVEYSFTRTKSVNNIKFFTCTCNMIIKLSIEEKILEDDKSVEIYNNQEV